MTTPCSTPMRPATGKVIVAVFLLLLLGVNEPRASLYIVDPRIPDAMEVADSLTGAVIATCVRRSTPEGPALFRVDTLLWGIIWDTFTADPPPGPRGSRFFEGRKHLLLLRDAPPPAAPAVRAVFPRRAAPDFEAWYGEILGGFRGLDVPSAVRLFEDLRMFPNMSPEARTAAIASWAGPESSVRPLASEVLRRHPQLWAAPIRDVYLQQLRTRPDTWLAEFVGEHPDSVTRCELRRMLRDSAETRSFALFLTVRDTTAWVRDSVVSIARAAVFDVDSIARPFGAEILEYGSPKTLWRIRTLNTIRGALASLNPEQPEERRVLLRLGAAAPDWHWIRYAVIHRMGGDTSQTFRRMLWETVRGDQRRARNWSMDTESGPDELTCFWTAAELHLALRDTSQWIRYYGVREAARRKDAAAAKLILEWLRTERHPDARAIMEPEALEMIRVLGEIGSEDVVDDLIAWSALDHEALAGAARRALIDIGDPRAEGLFRTLAQMPCDRLSREVASQIAGGLARLGDDSDIATFERWLEACPELRTSALYAIGCIGGPARMVEALVSLGSERTTEEILEYEEIEAWVRAARAKD